MFNRRDFIFRSAKAAALPACLMSLQTRMSSSEEATDRKPTGLVSDPDYVKHDTGFRHPESPKRYEAVINGLKKSDAWDELVQLKPRNATEAEILACHSADYLKTAKADIAAGLSSLSTGDTSICGDSLEVALKAAGGVLEAVDAVVAGKVQNAFCVVRPPGHHATPTRGMGFCVFNNIAIGARYAQKKHGIEKVLIVDWDVHHGNGTQDVFYEDGSVFFFSSHQHPWYPYSGMTDETGTGKGKNTVLNCPLPAGSGNKEIVGALKDKLLPLADKFKPDLILLSAGFDSRIDDPLGMFKLTDEDFAELTKLMMKFADEHAEGRLVSVLEGGYNLDGLAKATTAHCETLAGNG
jgi:acetoin utilization deacetylase AcuC-like enzyme